MTVLITGATSGIGLALTKQYQSSGEDVIACGRDKAKLEGLFNSDTACFDVTNKEQVLNACADLPTLDTVVLNAGDCEYFESVIPFDSAMFERIININLIGIGYCLEALLPKIKPGGQLVLVSSSAHLLPFPKAEGYGASKAGLSYLAKTLRIDLAPHNISVTLVEPGFVKTPLTDQNSFSMPFLVEVESAAKIMLAGIRAQKRTVRFPHSLMFVLHLFALLPSRIWDWVMKGNNK